jgi:hypothetical protein
MIIELTDSQHLDANINYIQFSASIHCRHALIEEHVGCLLFLAAHLLCCSFVL